MNKIVNKFLLTRDKFVPKLHLTRPVFTYRTCGPFTKYRERIRKNRETGDLKHLYKNKLDSGWFAYDAAYSDSKDLIKTNISDKFLKDRVYEIL